MRRWMVGSVCCAGVLASAAPQAVRAADNLVVNRADYADRLRGMWFGEALANWTGRMTEGSRRGTDLVNRPFYTDASWGTPSDTSPYSGQPIGFTFQSPWLTDDDTDVEYAYVHLMTQAQSPTLTPQQLTDGWRTHFTQALWYSNQVTRDLINRGAGAESTGVPAANPFSHYIDAQLTTEVFGALAPGRPDHGLRYGMAPMLMTSRGHATHAAQYFSSMYSLAAAVPAGLSPAQKMQWLSDHARQYIPSTSKAADVIDFVTADFAANPDVNDWESTRDRMHERYQQQAASNGFVYRDWTESSVNLAGGVMALLYGNGDYRRTVQIATLSGWDSDNATASLGGLFGLVHGYQHIASQFTPGELIDRYNMTPVPLSDDFHTRFTGLSNMPDHVPGRTNVEDTFAQLAERMLPVVDRAVAEMGGTVDLQTGTWTIPLLEAGVDPLSLSPTEQLMRRSANFNVRLFGGGATATSSAPPSVDANDLALVADGFEHDFRGLDYNPADKDGRWFSTHGSGSDADDEQWFAVTYEASVITDVVRFIEGDNLGTDGGFFASLRLELLVDGSWVPAPDGTALDEPLDPNAPFQVLDFTLPEPMTVDGVRVIGLSGASTFAVSAAELDAFIIGLETPGGTVPIVPEPSGAMGLFTAGALARRPRRRTHSGEPFAMS